MHTQPYVEPRTAESPLLSSKRRQIVILVMVFVALALYLGVSWILDRPLPNGALRVPDGVGVTVPSEQGDDTGIFYVPFTNTLDSSIIINEVSVSERARDYTSAWTNEVYVGSATENRLYEPSKVVQIRVVPAIDQADAESIHGGLVSELTGTAAQWHAQAQDLDVIKLEPGKSAALEIQLEQVHPYDAVAFNRVAFTVRQNLRAAYIEVDSYGVVGAPSFLDEYSDFPNGDVEPD